MLFRPAVESDLDGVISCGHDDPLHWPDTDQLRASIADGSRRLSRTWLAIDGDAIAAMARFWTPPGGDVPESLDGLYVDPSIADRSELAVELLRRAHAEFGKKPDYHTFLPADWRAEPEVVAALAWRRAALERVGQTDELERLRYRWEAGDPVPEPDPRLELREADDEAFVDAFCRVSSGSLDVGTVKGIADQGVEAEAREHMSVYLSMPGDRDWWRLAYAPDGSLAGLTIPSANNGGPVVGYLGVVPEHRGHGYVASLLGYITRHHAAAGAKAVTADTDTVNTPMAAAFERAGYAHFATRLVFSAT